MLFSDSKNVEEGLYLPWFRKIKKGYRGLLGCNWGANKQDLVEVNGFDEDYVHACVGEDNDIEWRLCLNGVHFNSLKHRAIVYHLYHTENYNNEASVVNNTLFEEKKKQHNNELRIWVSATSTGQEVYTIMMVLSYIWGQRNYPIPYNLKKNLAYIVTSILLVYLSFYIFKRNIFIGNAMLLLFAGSALYFEWKNLKAILFK